MSTEAGPRVYSSELGRWVLAVARRGSGISATVSGRRSTRNLGTYSAQTVARRCSEPVPARDGTAGEIWLTMEMLQRPAGQRLDAHARTEFGCHARGSGGVTRLAEQPSRKRQAGLPARHVQPPSAAHTGAARKQQRPQVSGQMRTSGTGSASMLAVPAGVAQLAERPSCKRAAEVAMTWPEFRNSSDFGTYSARMAATRAVLSAGSRHVASHVGRVALDKRVRYVKSHDEATEHLDANLSTSIDSRLARGVSMPLQNCPLAPERVLVNVATRTVFWRLAARWRVRLAPGRCRNGPGPVVELVLDGQQVPRRVGAQAGALGEVVAQEHQQGWA